MTRNFTKWLWVILLAISPVLVNAQFLMPDSGDGEPLTDCEGTLQDHAGDGQYSNNVLAGIAIAPLGASSIELTFTEFNFEPGYDDLSIYDGPDTSSPLIGTYDGETLPNGGDPIISTSGVVYLFMDTDGSAQRDGFTLNWIAGGGSAPPEALFSASDENPAANSPVLFMDMSNITGNSVWDFGDGQTSTETNPTHAFTTPGDYTVTLTITNCFGETDEHTVLISVQDFSSITVDPTSFDVELAFGDSITFPLTVTNTGGGDLIYDIDGPALLSEKQLQVLALINGADTDDEYPNTIEAINNHFTNYSLSAITTFDATELEEALESADVLLIPEQEDCNEAAFTSFAPVLQAFVEAGGTVIFNGNAAAQSPCIFNTGLFDGEHQNFISDDLEIELPDDPLVDGVSEPYTALAVTNYYDINNEDVVSVIEYNNFDVVCYRDIGAGRAILVGHDYRFSNENMDRVMANAVQSAANGAVEAGWLYISENADTLAGGESVVYDLEFNATTVFGGTYTIDLTFNTNDPENPTIVIPCTLTITGTPSFALSQPNFAFSSLMIGLTEQQTLTVTNPGTDSLHVTGISIDSPAFSTDPSSFSLYGGGAEQDVVITFAPESITVYDAVMTVSTNIGDFFVLLTGEGLGAPSITVDPPAVTTTIDAGTSTSVPIVISNTGEGPGVFNVDTSSLGVILEILVYQDGVDLAGEYPNMIEAFSTYYTNYNLTETSETDPDELANLLLDKNLLLIPEIEVFGASDAFSGYNELFTNFMNAGGTIIFCGTSGNNALLNTGLLPGATSGFDNGSGAVVDVPEHPIAAGIVEGFPLSNGSYPLIYGNEDFVTVVSQPTGNIVSGFQPFGNGHLAFVCFDYFDYEENAALLLANTMAWAEANSIVPWLSFSPDGGDLNFPDEQTITIDLDATDLLGGTYETEIVLSTNDPLNPTIVIPITLIVEGTPQIVASDDALDFGNVIIGNTNAITFTIDNPGTDSLFITNILSDLPEFTSDISSITLNPGGGSVDITITFAPDEIEDLNGILTIESNAGDITIDLTAFGVGAPAASWNPFTIDVTLLAGETTTETLELSNAGEGPLDWSIDGEGEPDILILTYGINTFNYANLLAAITAAYPGAVITEINTTNPEEFAEATEGQDLIVVPRQDTFSATEAVMTELGAVMTSFAQAGNGVIFVGTTCSYCVTANDMLSGGFYSYSTFGGDINILEESAPLVADLPSTLNDSPFYMFDFESAPGVVTIAEGPSGGTAMGVKKVGLGNVVYIGHDFSNFTTTDNMSTLINNAIDYAAGNLPFWMDLSGFDGSVEIDATNGIDVIIDTDGMLAGDYTFNLIIFTNQPTLPAIVIPVFLTVEAFPQALFTSPNQLSCDGVVSFFDLTVNNPDTWSWDFGDGNTSTEQNPVHLYEDNGTYTITLEACNSLGCDISIVEDYITVDFASTYCDTIAIPGSGELLVTSCNGVLQDSGGDGEYANNTFGTVTISPPGAIAIVLTFDFFDYENGPDDVFIYDGPDSNAPLIGAYTGTSLPNGGVIQTTTGSVTIVQDTDVSIVGDGFELVWDCIAVDAAPVPAFSYEIIDTCLGIVQFFDETENFPDEWLWTFGDGTETTSTEQNPVHQFTENGTFNVNLSACNIVDCALDFQEVVLSGVLDINIGAPDSVEIFTPIMLMDETENSVSWEWDFGNGNTAIGIANPVTFYQELGTYEISLTVTNSDGCTNTGTQTIVVAEEVVGIGGISNPSLLGGLSVYPNPTQGQFVLDYDFSNSRNLNINIVDAVGKLIYIENVDATNGYQKTINLSNYAAGIYTVSIQSEEGIAQQRIMLY